MWLVGREPHELSWFPRCLQNLLPHVTCHCVFMDVVFSIVFFTEDFMQEMGCSMDHSKLDFPFILLISWTIGDLIQFLVLYICLFLVKYVPLRLKHLRSLF